MSVPGSYITSIAGHRTFIPAPLPPDLTLDRSLHQQIEEATHLLGQVKMCRTLLPNAGLLIYSSLQREAIASSTIEGTIASPDELVLFQFSQHTERQAVREVANYRIALEWGCEQLEKLAVINERLILGLHERLLYEVRGHTSAGRFKTMQNAIGSPTDDISTALFVPPPPERTRELMSDLIRHINQDAESKVVQCALTHYQFETIHPFGDGNGRVGRLLIILQLIQQGMLDAPLIYPSVFFERRRQQYYDHLQAVRTNGDWNAWIAFFVHSLIQQCQETIRFTQTILQLKQNMQSSIPNISRRAAVSAVLDAFFEQPVLTTTNISQRAHMAYHSAQAALEILGEMGLVREITGKQKGKVFLCLPIYQAIFPEMGGRLGKDESAT